MLQNKYHPLKDTLETKGYLQILSSVTRFDMEYQIETDLHSLRAMDADMQTLELIDKLGEVEIHDNLYELIGFIVLNSIEITSINLKFKNSPNRAQFTPNHIWFDGTLDELHTFMRRIGMNPSHWLITEESI